MRNPIHPIVSDELFATLDQLNLLNRKTLRDLEIKRKYLAHREAGLSANEAIDRLQSEYGYLQFDTVRKIVYSVRLPEENRDRPNRARLS